MKKQNYLLSVFSAKLLLLSLLFALLPMTTFAQSEPYAVLNTINGGEKQLTFYYDDQKASRNGMDVGPFKNSGEIGWYNNRELITNVVFDDSFANCTSITSTAYWFYGCKYLITITGLSNLNTSNVTTMACMFFDCWFLESLDLNNFDTGNVTNMEGMFSNCSSLTSIDLSHFNTNNVTDMYSMFYGCIYLNSIDLSYFNTVNVKDMSQMFCMCSSLISVDLSKFDTSNVTNMFCMFAHCSSLSSLDVSHFNTSNVKDMSGMFEDCISLKSLDVSNFDTSNVTDMVAMFGGLDGGCSSLTSLDVSHFDTSNVTDMGGMFVGCSSLTSLDVSHFDTSKVTDMCVMFQNCSSLTSIDVSNFNTKNVRDMWGMFDSCSSLTSLDVSNFNTNGVMDMSQLFRKCSSLTSLDLSSFDTYKVTNMCHMFEDCNSLSTIYVNETNWSTANVTSSDEMFLNCANLVGGNGTVYNASHTDKEYGRIDKPGQPGYMTKKGGGGPVPYAVLSTTSFGDKQLAFYFDDNKAIRGGMDVGPFEGGGRGWDYCHNQITIVVFDNSFADCSSITSTAYWFYNCNNLITINGIDNLNTSNVTEMNNMFSGCSGLTSLDVSNFDTSNVTNMRGMFSNCSTLLSLDVSNFDTSNVTNMGSMFYRCSSLTSLDVSGFDTSNVTEMNNMFYGCSGLTSLDLSGFNTSNVTTMYAMFNGCSGLTSLDLSGFNTSNVMWMPYMFNGCSGLTSLDLSGFNTSNVTNMDGMFYGCFGLTTIYADETKWSTANVTESRSMFKNCTSLVGGNGTVYDENHVDAEYARIDKEGQPGYFTAKEMEPIENVDFGTDINEGTDLDGNVIGDIYYVISGGDGSYNAAEGCIVVTTPTEDSFIEGQDIFGEDFKAGFTGIVFKVPAGKGTVKVVAQTTGGMLLKVKIGDNDPIEMELEGKLTVTIPYNVSVPTYVYIYAGSNNTLARSNRAGETNGELKLYGIEVTQDETGIDAVHSSQFTVQSYYTLDGRKLDGVPAKKGIYIVNGRKIVVK